jgi:hypothetical protein
MQNLRRAHYELAVDAQSTTRVAAAFIELARAIWPRILRPFNTSPFP